MTRYDRWRKWLFRLFVCPFIGHVDWSVHGAAGVCFDCGTKIRKGRS
jgi:hypothetical protein